MVDSVAFIEKLARDVKPGERIWHKGVAYLVKRVEPGPYKSGLTFHVHDNPPIGCHVYDMIKVTSD